MPPHPPIFNPFFLFNNFSSPYSHQKKKKNLLSLSVHFTNTSLWSFLPSILTTLSPHLTLYKFGIIHSIFFPQKMGVLSLSLSLYIYIYKLSLGLSYNSNLGWFFFFWRFDNVSMVSLQWSWSLCLEYPTSQGCSSREVWKTRIHALMVFLGVLVVIFLLTKLGLK